MYCKFVTNRKYKKLRIMCKFKHNFSPIVNFLEFLEAKQLYSIFLQRND